MEIHTSSFSALGGGGIWEAAIKEAKHHNVKTVGETLLTFELSTVLATIEGIMNSRPLTVLSNNVSDPCPLTPRHFLIGETLTVYPERDLTAVPENRLSTYQKCSKITQSFWKRWSVEYLNRPKWIAQTKNLKVDQIVLLKEHNLPPLKWLLSRIIEIIPSSECKVRVVKIKTKDGDIRSRAKVCPFPADN